MAFRWVDWPVELSSVEASFVGIKLLRTSVRCILSGNGAGSDLKNVVLFDLGNTLAHYYVMQEFPTILKQAIINFRLLFFHTSFSSAQRTLDSNVLSDILTFNPSVVKIKRI